MKYQQMKMSILRKLISMFVSKINIVHRVNYCVTEMIRHVL